MFGFRTSICIALGGRHWENTMPRGCKIEAPRIVATLAQRQLFQSKRQLILQAAQQAPRQQISEDEFFRVRDTVWSYK